MEYINRDGYRHYAFQGVTKSGKPKFFTSRKETSEKGSRAEELPAEYEFHEAPKTARVFIRKRRSSAITVAERNLLHRLALEHTEYRIAIGHEKKCLELYAARKPVWDEHTQKIMSQAFRRPWVKTPFYPNFRFILVDQEKRLFAIEVCDYRNFEEIWSSLDAKPTSLESAATRCLPHINQESYFDLFKKGLTE